LGRAGYHRNEPTPGHCRGTVKVNPILIELIAAFHRQSAVRVPSQSQAALRGTIRRPFSSRIRFDTESLP
jgi:hypothetical protein